MRQATIGAHAPFTTIRILSTVAGLALLAGCQTTGGGDATRSSALGTSSVELIERDVEAPEVFQTTDLALWDGRPSLGGIWIASPEVREPERVIIRNEETGKFVIGALFKRERIAPGPRLQLSSDAAAAIGAIAGSPVMLDVVALRREAEPEPAPVIAEPEPEAVAEVEAETPEVEAAPVPVLEVAEAPAEEIAPGAAPVDVFLIAARALAAKRAAEAAEAAAIAAEAAAAVEEAATEGAAVPEISATSLDAPQPEAALPDQQAALTDPVVTAPTAEVRRPRRGLAALFTRRDPIAAPAPLPAAATQAAAPAFVQVGLFSEEGNARGASERLATAGVISSIRRDGSSWRVLIGPTPEADRAAILRKARELGFEDAYAVTG